MDESAVLLSASDDPLNLAGQRCSPGSGWSVCSAAQDIHDYHSAGGWDGSCTVCRASAC